MKQSVRIFVLIAFAVYPVAGALMAEPDAGTAEYNAGSFDSTAGFVAGAHARYPYALPSFLSINPALYNTLGVPVMEASYTGIVDLDQGSYSGHKASLWGNIPLTAGQVNTGIEFQSMDTSLADTGSAGRFHLGWSNTFRDSFLVGLGLETGYASGNGHSDWALNGKLGISQNLGIVGPFNQFTWHAALTNLGKEMTTSGGTYYRSPFTIRAGVSGGVPLGDDLDLYNALNVSLPGIFDVMLEAQSSLVLKDRYSVSLAWGMDFKQQLSSDYQNSSLLPRISFSYSLYNVDAPDIDTTLALYSPYKNHLGFSLGAALPLKTVDREGPDIELDIPNVIYLSPNNDGRQDAWDQPIVVEDPAGISSMQIRLMDGDEIAFTQSWEVEPQREESIYGIVKEVFQQQQTVVIPESILISGKGSDGTVLSDGQYQLEIEAKDILGNIRVIAPSTVVIDTAPPEVAIADMTIEQKVFSPNADGNKDELRITQSGSSEVLWEQRIVDAQDNVRWTQAVENSAPEDLVWNGDDSLGQRLPDGVYRYEISSRDLAGNENRAEVENIIINSVVSPVRIELAGNYFSPNGDSVQDSISLLPKPESNSGISSWTIEILNDREQPVGSLSGQGVPAERVSFDGKGNDGNVLPEGRYRAKFILTYVSGNRPQALSPWFTLDVTAPEIQLELSSTLFSPNNDQRSDEMSIFQEASSERLWEGAILDEEGQTIRSYAFRGEPDMEIVWDGRDNNGALAPDGQYRYRISAVDEAGNRGRATTAAFTLDTSDAEVLVSAGFDAFSPNADGTKDTQSFRIRVNNNQQVAQYQFTISDAAGSAQRVISGMGAVPETIRWDGRNDEGRILPDGIYQANLSVELVNRSVGSAETRQFTLDTQAPVIEVSSDYQVFSPNGDEQRDTLPIRQVGRGEKLYEGRIVDETGNTVAEYFWENELASFQWDGLDQYGNLAANGVYSYELVVIDDAGNESSAGVERIELDSRNTSVFLTVSDSGISPNADGYKDQLEISMYTNITDGINSWALEILDEDGEVRRSTTGTSLAAQSSFVFDGKDNNGQLLSGRFTARFSVVYRKGDRPVATSSAFLVDVQGPVLGKQIAPTPFGPDGDGLADVLNIDLQANDPAGVAGWRFGIYDRVGNLFKEFASEGSPESRIYWDGLSDSGERVISAEDYRYEFEAIDRLGNVSQVEGLIPIDILVIRDGDNYKVQISNIVFEPNSPRIVLGDVSEVGLRNQQILNRLVEVFSKYPQYRIIIEGHANNISGTQREQTEELIPLSEGRAQAVKDQMVLLGVDPNRISIVGRGGASPLVPFSDEENRWKNRRVEFILVR